VLSGFFCVPPDVYCDSIHVKDPLPMPKTAHADDRVTVLLAESEPRLGGVVAEVLEEEGFRVLCIPAAASVPDLVRAHQPDLLLLAPASPQDGPEVLHALRSDPATRHVPVLLAANDRVIEQIGAEPECLVRKPFDLDLLVEHVWRLLNSRLSQA
jgi:DNA-binding response OmpR family regulator